MNKETIEKAAKEYAEENPWYPGETYYESDIREMEEKFADAYIAGADWRINSVWHDIDKEKPMPGKHVVNEHWFDFVAEDWKDLDRIMKKWPFKRWAYVDDLMPDGKEDER